MQRIAVGDTISGAYGFAFARFFAVLAIAWLPHLLFFALSAGWIYLVAPDLPRALASGNFDQIDFIALSRAGGLIWILQFITQSMTTVGLQKKALGKMEGRTFFYFSLGAPVWRMIGAYLLAIVAIVIMAIALAIVAGLLGYLAVQYVPKYGTAIAVVLGVVALLWFFYAVVRLTFFLPAVVVAEERVGITRSWELGAGNFWRIVIVLLAVFIPVAIGFNILGSALLGPFLPTNFMAPHIAMPANGPTTPQQVLQMYRSLLQQMLPMLLPVLPAAIIFTVVRSIVFLGLGNGAVARAYLGVTGGSSS